MGMIKFGFREGSWWLRSKSDPRWNVQGRGICGGLVMPPDCTHKLEQLKKKYGQPPEDLEYGYMKD